MSNVNLLSIVQDPAFIQQAQIAINEFSKDVGEVDFIEHGADNVVALVNKEFVFRFPRNEQAAKRLAFETALLQKAGKQLTAVQIPELLKVHVQPLYVVAKYIDGDHLTGPQIQALPEEAQVAIGRKIATFTRQFNQAISGLEVRRLRSESAVDNLDEPWEPYFERLFVKDRLPNERLRPFVDEYYSLWKDYVSKEQRIYAIHDDLHPSNLLFSSSQLTGIVDFGDANTGSIEEELRWLYLMGPTVLQSAADTYQQLSGEQVNLEHVRVWAIMHELSSYTSGLAKQQTTSYPFLRAQEHLKAWLPNFTL